MRLSLNLFKFALENNDHLQHKWHKFLLFGRFEFQLISYLAYITVQQRMEIIINCKTNGMNDVKFTLVTLLLHGRVFYKSSTNQTLHCSDTEQMATIVKYSGFMAFLFLLFEESKTYGSYFKALSGYGEDNNSKDNSFSKAFHQCDMKESCKYVVKNIMKKEFAIAKSADELPMMKGNYIVWQKQGKWWQFYSSCGGGGGGGGRSNVF